MTEIEISYSRMKDKGRWYGIKIREQVLNEADNNVEDTYYSLMNRAKKLIDKEVEG